MSNSATRLRTIVELVAAAGVVISLVFVGVQVRQSTVAVRGATFQALSDASAEEWLAAAQDSGLAALLARVYFDDASTADFSRTENIRLFLYYMAWLQCLENSYLQHSEGLISDRVFDSYGWHNALLGRRHFRMFWQEWGGRTGVSPAFATFLESQTDMKKPGAAPSPIQGPGREGHG